MQLTSWIWENTKNPLLRLTRTRYTTAFFLFAFVHCFAQAFIQAFLYSIDENASSFTNSILTQAEVPTKNFAWLMRSNHDEHYTLQLCSATPQDKSTSPCVTVFETGVSNITIPAGFRRRSDMEDMSMTGNDLDQVVSSASNSSDVAVMMVNNTMVFLDEQCTRVLVYPHQVFLNSEREELALVGSEFWLFGISTYAVLYDSIPHLLAAFFMRILSVGWSSYSIWRTNDIMQRLDVLVTNGPCQMDLYPTYRDDRISFQIPDLVLNVTALLVSGFLVWHLAWEYAYFMFTRAGAPPGVVKVYRYFLGIFVCLQMSVYLLITSMGLWVDQLVNGAIARISSHTAIYLALFIFTLIALIPWISMGWFAVRREMRRTLIVFLALAFILLVCWSIMYYSEVYRWTWIQWPFFASITVAAQLDVIGTLVLGVLCWRNFHKGLKQYLHVERVLGKSGLEPDLFPHNEPQGRDSWSSTAKVPWETYV